MYDNPGFAGNELCFYAANGDSTTYDLSQYCRTYLLYWSRWGGLVAVCTSHWFEPPPTADVAPSHVKSFRGSDWYYSSWISAPSLSFTWVEWFAPGQSQSNSTVDQRVPRYSTVNITTTQPYPDWGNQGQSN
jgi:hypothetical protein